MNLVSIIIVLVMVLMMMVVMMMFMIMVLVIVLMLMLMLMRITTCEPGQQQHCAGHYNVDCDDHDDENYNVDAGENYYLRT